MPGLMTVQAANTTLTAENVKRFSRDEIAELGAPGSFVESAASLLDLSAEDKSYLADIPTSLQEAMRAAIVDAVSNGRAVQIQFSPGYDFSVKLWEFGEAVGIHVSGPYTGQRYARDTFKPSKRARGRKPVRVQRARKTQGRRKAR